MPGFFCVEFVYFMKPLPLSQDLESSKYVSVHFDKATSCFGKNVATNLALSKRELSPKIGPPVRVRDIPICNSTQPILQPNTTSAITLILQRSNCDGCTWPR